MEGEWVTSIKFLIFMMQIMPIKICRKKGKRDKEVAQHLPPILFAGRDERSLWQLCLFSRKLSALKMAKGK